MLTCNNYPRFTPLIIRYSDQTTLQFDLNNDSEHLLESQWILNDASNKKLGLNHFAKAFLCGYAPNP